MGRPISQSLNKIVAELSAYDMVIALVKNGKEPLPKSATESLFFEHKAAIESAMVKAGTICVQEIIAKLNAPAVVESVEVAPTPEVVEYATQIAAGHPVKNKKVMSA